MALPTHALPKVYLAGPISGLTYAGGQEWRSNMKAILAPEIACFSPLRAKEYLRVRGVLEQSYATPLSSDRGIMTRDHNDCLTADLILVNLQACGSRVSQGTLMEIAWGFAYRKPVVAIMERKGNVHDHPMVREAIGFRTDDWEEAVHIVRSILLSS